MQREKYAKHFDTFFNNIKEKLNIEKALESSDEDNDLDTLEVLK